jgi:bifunctional UDP-N-acetylglucosamine pyrophosphorylase/glucosamine-1-phosphate N-acetyltransferase
MIEDFAEQYAKDKKDLNIKIVSQFEILGPKEKEYGTACPIKCVRNMVKNENFISLCGDNFYTVEDLKLMNNDDGFCYVAGLKNEHPEKFGVLIEDGEDFLDKIIEKPKEFVGDLINTSLYKFTPEIFEKVFQIGKSPRGEYEITDAISLLAKERKVKIKKINDFWMDFGKPEDVEKFSNFLKNDYFKNESRVNK